MYYKYLGFILLSLNLFGCGTMAYTPQENPLRDSAIDPLSISGDVQINNNQTSKDKVIVYSYGGSKLESNYYDITQVMVEQAGKELKKHGNFQISSNNKTIDISVNHLLSVYKFFHWKSEIRFTAKLGNGEIVEKTVTHGSADLRQDLNGCIAEAVVFLYKDEKVKEYLKS